MSTLTMYRGDTKHIDFALTEDGSAVDITGSSVTFTLVKETDADDAVLQHTLGSGVQLTAPASGQGRVTLQPTDTADLDPDLYLFDIQITLTTGERYTIPSDSRGMLVIRRDVTPAS